MVVTYPVWLGAVKIRSIPLVILPSLLALTGYCEKLHCIPNYRTCCLRLKPYLYNVYRIHTLAFGHVLPLIWLFSAALNINVILLFIELMMYYYWRSLIYRQIFFFVFLIPLIPLMSGLIYQWPTQSMLKVRDNQTYCDMFPCCWHFVVLPLAQLRTKALQK